ncbi:MAG: Ig-like domain-containing protein, partial [Bacteroidales bacterium]|nr:Ig-like domain-containing protein [Bacteroidales bacterium]
MMKTIQAGSTLNLAPRLKRSNVDFDGTQQWSSSDESVATVDENGVVTAVSEGTVTITVQETDVLKVIYTTEENGESVTYEIGSKHDFKTSFVMYVTPAPIVPDLVIPWNQYGEDVQGIGVDGMSDYWQEGDSKIITDALEAYQEGLSTTYSPTLKDIFMLHIAGTVNCSGQFDFGLADEREQVSYWGDMSVFQKGYKVVADESFDFTIALPISEVVQHTEYGDVPLAEPHLMFAFMPEAGSLLGIEKNIECYFDKYTMEFIPAGTVDVSLSQKEYSLDVAGESSVTLSLNLKTLSGNGEWKSLNEDVATVANGVVTGVAQGVAEIVYVEKYYGADFSDTCKITVLNSTRSPLPETETNISYCMGDKTVPLTAKTVDGGTLTWYDATLAVLESAPTPSADDAG